MTDCDRKVSDGVAAAIGNAASDVDNMIFLRPVGSDDSAPRRGEKLFAMAILHSALPRIITIDWTYGGTWSSLVSSKGIPPTSQTKKFSVKWSGDEARLQFTKLYPLIFYACTWLVSQTIL
jgi:hypothetical protein